LFFLLALYTETVLSHVFLRNEGKKYTLGVIRSTIAVLKEGLFDNPRAGRGGERLALFAFTEGVFLTGVCRTREKIPLGHEVHDFRLCRGILSHVAFRNKVQDTLLGYQIRLFRLYRRTLSHVVQIKGKDAL
jgi:hypothetical protein